MWYQENICPLRVNEPLVVVNYVTLVFVKLLLLNYMYMICLIDFKFNNQQFSQIQTLWSKNLIFISDTILRFSENFRHSPFRINYVRK